MDNLKHSGGNLIAISTCFIVFDTLFLIARLVSRKRLRSIPWGMDDLFAVLGYIACIAMCAVGLCFVIYANVGYPVQEAVALNSNALVTWAKLIIALEVVYTTAVSLTKISMLCLFYRIFSIKPYRIATICLMVLVVMVWLAIMLAGVLECVPTAYFWDKSLAGSCFNTEDYFKWGPLPGVIVDVFILTLPIIAVWRTQAPKARKIDLTVMFSLGGLGLLACIARNALFWLHSAYADPTYASWYLVGISVIEPSFYLIACCLVAVKPLAKWVLEEVVPTSWKSSLHTLFGNNSASAERGPYERADADADANANSQKYDAEQKPAWSEPHPKSVSRAYLAEATSGWGGGVEFCDDGVIEMRRDVTVEELSLPARTVG